MEDVGVSLCDGVVFVDTSDLPPAEAVIPTTPVKGGPQNSNEMATTGSNSALVLVSTLQTITTTHAHFKCCYHRYYVVLGFYAPLKIALV